MTVGRPSLQADQLLPADAARRGSGDRAAESGGAAGPAGRARPSATATVPPTHAPACGVSIVASTKAKLDLRVFGVILGEPLARYWLGDHGRRQMRHRISPPPAGPVGADRALGSCPSWRLPRSRGR